MSFSWKNFFPNICYTSVNIITLDFVFVFAEEFQDFLSNHDELAVLLSSLLPHVENHVRESILIWQKVVNYANYASWANFTFCIKNFLKDTFFKMKWKVNVEMTLRLELFEFFKSAALSERLNWVSKQFWIIYYKIIYQQ